MPRVRPLDAFRDRERLKRASPGSLDPCSQAWTVLGLMFSNIANTACEQFSVGAYPSESVAEHTTDNTRTKGQSLFIGRTLICFWKPSFHLLDIGVAYERDLFTVWRP